MPVAHPDNPRFKDRTGAKFGRLTVLEYAGERGEAKTWLCRCECGKMLVVRASALVSGDTKSCGCLCRELARKAATKHGMHKSPARWVWSTMIRRCANPKDHQYKNYGGRGITVDPRWLKFENFLADMGAPPAGLSLDRRDNEKGYSASNCRWATPREQANNTRVNRLLEYRGRRQTMAEWNRELGMKRGVLGNRLYRGWSVERAIETPYN